MYHTYRIALQEQFSLRLRALSFLKHSTKGREKQGRVCAEPNKAGAGSGAPRWLTAVLWKAPGTCYQAEHW